jgi:hypothetical protein
VGRGDFKHFLSLRFGQAAYWQTAARNDELRPLLSAQRPLLNRVILFSSEFRSRGRIVDQLLAAIGRDQRSITVSKTVSKFFTARQAI